ncbi:MAG: 50S ribosomal protein L9 [bacterium]|nr:50S ribosomal protein L9 [bacterium]
MKVILIKDVLSLGKKYDLKTVADGYARNFLLPRGLAVFSTPVLMKDAERKKAAIITSQETDLKTTQELARQLDGYALEIHAKAAEEGTLYATVGIEELKSAFAKKKIDIGNARLGSGELLKELGKHSVILNLPHAIEVKINVVVVKEASGASKNTKKRTLKGKQKPAS